MIDTIKFRIPVSEKDLFCIKSLTLAAQEKEVRGTLNTETGEFRVNLFRDYIPLPSSSKKIAVFFRHEQFLEVELSLPKFYRWTNSRMLYDFETPVLNLKKVLDDHFGINLPNVSVWQLMRVDICWNWLFEDKRLPAIILEKVQATVLTNSQFRMHKRNVYNSGLYFPSRDITAKLYLKHEEFKKNDDRALFQEMGADHLSSSEYHKIKDSTEGILRFEVELRKKMLHYWICKKYFPALSVNKTLKVISDLKKEDDGKLIFDYLRSLSLKYGYSLVDLDRILYYRKIIFQDLSPEMCYNLLKYYRNKLFPIMDKERTAAEAIELLMKSGLTSQGAKNAFFRYREMRRVGQTAFRKMYEYSDQNWYKFKNRLLKAGLPITSLEDSDHSDHEELKDFLFQLPNEEFWEEYAANVDDEVDISQRTFY